MFQLVVIIILRVVIALPALCSMQWLANERKKTHKKYPQNMSASLNPSTSDLACLASIKMFFNVSFVAQTNPHHARFNVFFLVEKKEGKKPHCRLFFRSFFPLYHSIINNFCKNKWRHLIDMSLVLYFMYTRYIILLRFYVVCRVVLWIERERRAPRHKLCTLCDEYLDIIHSSKLFIPILYRFLFNGFSWAFQTFINENCFLGHIDGSLKQLLKVNKSGSLFKNFSVFFFVHKMNTLA